jgi:ribosomal-protein-alanine N-acetyltransferase
VLFSKLCNSEIYDFISSSPPTDAAALEREYTRLSAGCPRPGEQWLNWVAYRDSEAVATLQATVFSDRTANIGYVVFPDFWGQGIGAAGVRWILGELRRQGIQKVHAFVDPANVRSLRLLASAGFRELSVDGVRHAPKEDRAFELVMDDR